ncbi:MAG: flagellar biosynthesis protein FlhF [Thermovirga sp.]|jgi:flagellar biosynthesis protein FlhF|nr:flagellar biosynthesis protein FlhF [Thermovirga sp.]MDN5368144.1 flagellar biosynthesis protein FlhF [Thermovirga sp.]
MRIVKEIEFEAKTEKEAFDKVRQRLGSDGVILSIQTVKVPFFLPFLKKTKLVVRAGIVEEEKKPSYSSVDRELERKQIEVFKALLEFKGNLGGKEKIRGRTLEELAENVEDEVEIALSQPSSGSKGGRDPFPPKKQESSLRLKEVLEGEIPTSVLSHIFGEALEEDVPISLWMNREKEGFFMSKGEGSLMEALGGRKIMIVGPTGVGKTTTIAKIAALAIQEGLPVVLLSSDNYRVAAVEQIRTYARVLNVPLEVINTGSELVPILRNYPEESLFIMDTAGHGFRESDRLSHIKGVYEHFVPDKVHIAVSATMKFQDVKLAFESVRTHVAIDGVILTKVDETQMPSSLLWVPKFMGVPLSFVTTGQNVPRDIHVASCDFVTSCFLAGVNSVV